MKAVTHPTGGVLMFTVLGHTLFGFWEIKKNDITNRYYAFSSFPGEIKEFYDSQLDPCLLYTSPSPRDGLLSRMPSSA